MIDRHSTVLHIFCQDGNGTIKRLLRNIITHNFVLAAQMKERNLESAALEFPSLLWKKFSLKLEKVLIIQTPQSEWDVKTDLFVCELMLLVLIERKFPQCLF